MSSWLTNYVKPRLKAFVGEKTDVPDNLWVKCPGCQTTLFHRDLHASQYVCGECGHHLRLPAQDRLEMLFDDNNYKVLPLPDVVNDPLKFKDDKKYVDRLKDTQAKTKKKDALIVAEGTMGGEKLVAAIFDFSFMGGSMGIGVGEGFVMAARRAVETRSTFLAIPSSGGARMQEGILSLMQLPRTIIALNMVKEAGLPYIVLLSDPTTGGVTASFAMLGDIHIAEPGATIGFAGRRVIQQTVRESLPAGFQTSEYLLDHGMVDKVVPRAKQKETLTRMIQLLTKPQMPPKTQLKIAAG